MKNYFILALIVIFAGLFRFHAIGYDLPIVYNPDESYLLEKAIEVADGQLEHGIIIRGSLPYYVIGSVIKLTSLVYPPLQNGQKSLSNAYKIDPTPFYIIGRSICVIYALLEIIILFFIGKTLGSTQTGLFAAFFDSISNLSITLSHQITPDTALSATLLFTIFLIIKAYQINNYRMFILASLFTGFSAAQKLPGIIILPILLLSFFCSPMAKKMNLFKRLSVLISLFLWVSFSYWLAYPFLFQDIGKLMHEWVWENETTSWFYNETILKDVGILEKVKKYVTWLQQGTGTFYFYLSIIGAILLPMKRQFMGIIVNLYVLMYLIGMSIPGPYYNRWILPLVPFISIYSALFLMYLFHSLSNTQKIKTFVPLLILISLAPLFRSIFITILSGSPDTRNEEIVWLKKNKVSEEKVLRDIQTSVNIPKDEQRLSKIDFSKLQNFDYFISSSYHLDGIFTPDTLNNVRIINRYSYVFSNFEVIQQFSSKSNRTGQNDVEFLLSFPTWNIHQKKGPYISIFDLHKNVPLQKSYLF